MNNAKDRKLNNYKIYAKWIVIALIVCGAFVIRLINIEFGLPYYYHVDEGNKVKYIEKCLNNDFLGTNFHHPTFMIYSSAGLIYLFQKSFNIINTPIDICIFARIWTSFLAACTVLCVILIGFRYLSFICGIFAGIFLSLSTLHICLSHYIKEDIHFVFWLMLSFYFLIKFISLQNIKNIIISGLLGGFAFSTKYVGIILSFSLFLTASGIIIHDNYKKDIKTEWKKMLSLLALYVAMLIIGFVIFTPYSLTADSFKKGFSYELNHVFAGHDNYKMYPWKNLWGYHLLKSIIPGISIPVLLMAFAGFYISVKTKNTVSIFIAISSVVLYFIIESSYLKPPPNAERYILPVIPFLCLLGGLAVSYLYENIRKQYFKPLLIIFIFILLIPLINRDYLFIKSIRMDTRDKARLWIYKNIHRNSNILIYYWDSYSIKIGDYPINTFYNLSFENANNLNDIGKYDYIIISSLHYVRYFNLYTDESPYKTHYKYIMENLKLTKEFKTPYLTYGFHNPTIKIYSRQNEIKVVKE